MKFQSLHILQGMERDHMKGHAVRTAWGLLASIAVIGALVMAMPL